MGDTQDKPVVPQDVVAYTTVLGRRKVLFLQRRAQYGDHLRTNTRFPSYLTANLYSKCVRVIMSIDGGKMPSADTLLDLGNYADMVLSTMVGSEHGTAQDGEVESEQEIPTAQTQTTGGGNDA